MTVPLSRFPKLCLNRPREKTVFLPKAEIHSNSKQAGPASVSERESGPGATRIPAALFQSPEGTLDTDMK